MKIALRKVILTRKYLPSYKRVDNPPAMKLTERDKKIILAIYEYRLMSAPQVEALFFQSEKPRGRQTSCQRRLQLLFHHGYLDRLLMPVVLGEGRVPYVYVLDELGADLVSYELGVDRALIQWRPQNNQISHPFVNHSLVVNDFRVAMNLLSQSGEFLLKQWIGEAEFRTRALQNRVPIRMRGARIIRNYPDGYFSTVSSPEKQEAHFFLEMNQGTMSNKKWQDKIRAYREFRSRGLSEVHFGTRNFRLLTVTTNKRRLQNLKRATEKVGGDHFHWFTTQECLNVWRPGILLEPIWQVATLEEKQTLF